MPFRFAHRAGVPKWSIKELGGRYIPRDVAFQEKVPRDIPDDIYFRPYATPRFFEDGFLAQSFGLSRVAIAEHIATWQREVNSLSRMIHMEVWGRLFVLGQSSPQLCAHLESFGPG